MAVGHILFLTQAKKIDGSTSIAQTHQWQGKFSLTDVVDMSVDCEDVSFVATVYNLVKVLHQVAISDSCRVSWQFSVPTFVNRVSATSPSVPAMSAYLLNEDCIGAIKWFNEDCDTKEQLYNNEYCDTILETVFGMADKDWNVLESVADDQRFEI